jgi:ribonuclease P protein component
MGVQSFRKEERIAKKQDYLRIYAHGKRLYSKSFTIVVCPNQTDKQRLGIAVGKKVGNAVERNRVKRLLREFFRLNKNRFSPSLDIVIIAKKGILPLTYQNVYTELVECLHHQRKNG